MPDVTIKIPRRLQRVKIYRSEDYSQLFKEDVNSQDKKNIEVIKKAEKPIFIEEFSFSNLNEPVEISLKKIPEESIPLLEVKKEVQNAYDHGFADGQQVGKSTYETEIQNLQEWIRNFDLIAAELRSRMSEEIKSLEQTLPAIALMIAEHILEHECSNNSNIVIEQTIKAIKSLNNDIIFKIKVNPINYKVLENVKSKLLSDSSMVEQILIVADESVDNVGCILETSAGTIDARLSTQLERIRQTLNNVSDNFEL